MAPVRMAEMVVRGRILLDSDKCIGCGYCADACVVGMYELRDVKTGGTYRRKVVIVGDQEYCLICRECEAKCPEKAIQIIEEELE